MKSSVYANDISPENMTFDEEDEVSSHPLPSIMYDADGEFHGIKNTYNNKPLFRKMKPDDNEKLVARILQVYPHPNIVNIYHVCDDYIDMELLSTDDDKYNVQDVERAHAHMLKHCIVYVDWKPDNYGTDLNGITKVYDFDSAGIFDKMTDTWVYHPPANYSMRHATAAGHNKPTDVDKYTFDERDIIW